MNSPSLITKHHVLQFGTSPQSDVLTDRMGLARLHKHMRTTLQARIHQRHQTLMLHSGKSALEWRRIFHEDMRSARLRGVLTLPMKTLQKLKSAFDRGTMKAKELAPFGNIVPSMQRKQVLAALHSSELSTFVDTNDTSLWDFGTFAEWWRQATIQKSKGSMK
jgi:hypothetical protein